MSVSGIMKTEKPLAIRASASIAKGCKCLFEGLQKTNRWLFWKRNRDQIKEMLGDNSLTDLVLMYIKGDPKNIALVAECLFSGSIVERANAAKVLMNAARKGIDLSGVFGQITRAVKNNIANSEVYFAICACAADPKQSCSADALHFIARNIENMPAKPASEGLEILATAMANNLEPELMLYALVTAAIRHKDHNISFEAAGRLNRIALMGPKMKAILTAIVDLSADNKKRFFANAITLNEMTSILITGLKKQETEELAIKAIVGLITTCDNGPEFIGTLFSTWMDNINDPKLKTRIINALLQSKKFMTEVNKNTRGFEALIVVAAKEMAELKANEASALDLDANQ